MLGNSYSLNFSSQNVRQREIEVDSRQYTSSYKIL